MNENYSHHSASTPASDDADLVSLVKKLEQHLVYLEKKIDTLLQQSQGGGQSFQHNRRFSKPHRGSFHSDRQDRGRRDFDRSGGGGRGFDAPRRHDQGEGRGFAKRRGGEFEKKDDNAGNREEGRGFFRKRKGFFRRDRD